MDEGSLLMKGQLSPLQLMFYLLSPATETGRGTMIDIRFCPVPLNESAHTKRETQLRRIKSI